MNRCEREIGRPGNWHTCDRPAVVASERMIGQSSYTLHYCARHAHCAHETGSRLITIRRITVIREVAA